MLTQKMRILGIDPGTRVAGYGVVDLFAARHLKAVAAGAWKLDVHPQLSARLATLAIELKRILTVYEPTHMCVELSFLAQNPKTALFLGHARGVILSEAHQTGLKISEISATSAKKMISGNGRTQKASIAKIMSSLLGFQLNHLPYDATDALAIACADAMRMRNGNSQDCQMLVFKKNKIQKCQTTNPIFAQWQQREKRMKKSFFKLGKARDFT
jgi:crossover junction endodeoxyribonuclease RuvC